jgi:putative ABC transport system permease protein
VTGGELWRRLRFWRRRDALDRALAAELRDHLALLAREYEHAGLTPLDAQRAATRRLGNVGRIREESRDSWGFRFTDTLLQDLRHAVRALRRTPGLAITVILTLGLGIGATAAIFSVVYGVLLRPLPLPYEDRLVTICETGPTTSTDWCRISPPDMADVVARSRTIATVGIGREWSADLGTAKGIRRVHGGIATPGLFAALGATVIRGRLFAESDLLTGDSDLVLLTSEMWHTKFGGDTGIIGRSLMLDGNVVRVVGVLHPGFQAPEFDNVELWRLLHLNSHEERYRNWQGFVAYGRLKPNVSLAQARADLAPIAASIRSEHFANTARWGIAVKSLRDLVVGSVRSRLVLFLAAVALVLLIACANVGNLLLARGAMRGREIAARAALGAGPRRIVRTLLVESLLLAGAGAVAGLALALAAIRAFRVLAPAGLPRIASVDLDVHVLLFAATLAVLTALGVGLVPALRASRIDLAQALREGGRAAPARRSPLGSILVAVELSMAVVLVAGAGALTRSFAAFNAWRPGFDREHLLLFSLSQPGVRYDSAAKLATMLDRAEAELNAIPGVKATATASAGPIFGERETWEMELEGLPADERVSIRWSDVSPGYFRTLGVARLQGRDLDGRDVYGAPLTCLVNATLARRFWPGLDPIGRTIVFPVGTDRQTFHVVGVVADVPPLAPGAAPEPEMYWSNRQQPRPDTWVAVRTSVAPASIESLVHARIAGLDRDMGIGAMRTMPELMRDELTTPRFTMLLLQAFGLVALLLAAVGTYGLVAYLVTIRRREIGIRLALGAQRTEVTSGVIWQGLRLAFVGIMMGLITFVALGTSIAALAPGVSLRDPMSFVSTSAILVAITVAACAIPAIRAGRTDPALTLGVE